MAHREGELRVPEVSRSPGSQQGEEKVPGEVREAELGSCSGFITATLHLLNFPGLVPSTVK